MKKTHAEGLVGRVSGDALSAVGLVGFAVLFLLDRRGGGSKVGVWLCHPSAAGFLMEQFSGGYWLLRLHAGLRG
jgi:hypothetical protein